MNTIIYILICLALITGVFLIKKKKDKPKIIVKEPIEVVDDKSYLSDYDTFEEAVLGSKGELNIKNSVSINSGLELKDAKNIKILGDKKAVLTGGSTQIFYLRNIENLTIEKLKLRAKNKLTDVNNKKSKINDPDYNTRIGVQVVNSKKVKVNNNDFKYFYQIATYFSNVNDGEYIGNTTSEMFRDATIDRIQPTGILVNKASKNIRILKNRFINIFGLHGNRNSHAIYVGQGCENVLIDGNLLENTHNTSADDIPGNDIAIYGVGKDGALNKNVTITNNILRNTSSNLHHTENGVFKDNISVNSRLAVGKFGLIEDCEFICDNPKFKAISGMVRTKTKDPLHFKNVKFINKTKDKSVIGFKNYADNPNVTFENVDFVNCRKVMER